jgi:hypothetical protein
MELPLDHQEIQSIKKEIFEEADERYVHVGDCSDKQESINKKFANDDKRIDKLIDRLEIWNKLLWAITSASIGALVVAFFDLILK